MIVGRGCCAQKPNDNRREGWILKFSPKPKVCFCAMHCMLWLWIENKCLRVCGKLFRLLTPKKLPDHRIFAQRTSARRRYIGNVFHFGVTTLIPSGPKKLRNLSYKYARKNGPWRAIRGELTRNLCAQSLASRLTDDADELHLNMR